MIRKEYERVSPESVGIPSNAIWDMVEALEKVAEMHSIMVLRHGKICVEGWWSPYGPGVPHGLQSLSKTYAATAIGLAYTEGFLRLDERLVDLFPEYLPEKPSEYLKKLTVYDLLIMGGGMEHCTPGGTDWIQQYFLEPVVHEPGTTFFYNTAGSNMLGAVIGVKTGKSLHAWLSEKLFVRLGINAQNIRWIRNGDGTEIGGGGMLAATEDNLRLMDLYRQKGVWEGERLLAEDFVRMATTKRIDTEAACTNGPLAIDHLLGYGFQMWMCQPAGAYRADGAFGQYAIVFPEQDMVISLTETSRADDNGAQCPLDAIYSTILKSLSDEALPENPESLSKLRRRMKTLAIERPEYRPYSPLADQLNGAVWRVREGIVYLTPYSLDVLSQKCLTNGIQEFSFHFSESCLRIDFLEDDVWKSVSAAMDGTRRLNILPNSQTPFHKVYLSAFWSGENILCLSCRWIESAYEHTLSFTFRDPTVTITFSDLIWLREPAPLSPAVAVRA